MNKRKLYGPDGSYIFISEKEYLSIQKAEQKLCKKHLTKFLDSFNDSIIMERSKNLINYDSPDYDFNLTGDINKQVLQEIERGIPLQKLAQLLQYYPETMGLLTPETTHKIGAYMLQSSKHKQKRGAPQKLHIKFFAHFYTTAVFVLKFSCGMKNTEFKKHIFDFIYCYLAQLQETPHPKRNGESSLPWQALYLLFYIVSDHLPLDVQKEIRSKGIGRIRMSDFGGRETLIRAMTEKFPKKNLEKVNTEMNSNLKNEYWELMNKHDNDPEKVKELMIIPSLTPDSYIKQHFL